MEAEWTDNTDKQRCLCCLQFVERGRPVKTQEQIDATMSLLKALGFTRESLLTKHRAQIDFQSPGLSAWLQGQ